MKPWESHNFGIPAEAVKCEECKAELDPRDKDNLCKPCATEILVHKDCNGPVKRIGEDGIDFCEDCETVVEGYTESITETELLKRIG